MTQDVKWTVPASEGACRALLDHARLINPNVLIMAQGAAIQRGKDEKRGAAIIRADVEQAIIANQSAAITAQANRIRDLVSDNSAMLKLIKESIDAEEYGPEDWEHWNNEAIKLVARVERGQP